jgi:hypothetical protein
MINENYKIDRTYTYNPKNGVYYLINMLNYTCSLCSTPTRVYVRDENRDLRILNFLFRPCPTCRAKYPEEEIEKFRKEEILIFRLLVRK